RLGRDRQHRDLYPTKQTNPRPPKLRCQRSICLGVADENICHVPRITAARGATVNVCRSRTPLWDVFLPSLWYTTLSKPSRSIARCLPWLRFLLLGAFSGTRAKTTRASVGGCQSSESVFRRNCGAN